jgi:hypothetical protein
MMNTTASLPSKLMYHLNNVRLLKQKVGGEDDDDDDEEVVVEEIDDEEIDDAFVAELLRIYPLCAVCLKSMKQNKGSIKHDSVTLDRVDSKDRRYLKGKVVPTCAHCNSAKWYLTGEHLAATPLFNAFGLRLIVVRENEIARYAEEKERKQKSK